VQDYLEYSAENRLQKAPKERWIKAVYVPQENSVAL
jgi:hypothetical protein